MPSLKGWKLMFADVSETEMMLVYDLPLFSINEYQEYTIEVVANDDEDKNVKVYFEMLGDVDAIIEYKEGEHWIEISETIDEFKLQDETHTYRAKFLEEGT